MDVTLSAITAAMATASVGWIAVRFRSSDRSDRLSTMALQLQLLIFLSWTALGSDATSPIRVTLSVLVALLLFAKVWEERELRVLRVWPLYVYTLVLFVSGVFSDKPMTALAGASAYAMILGSMSVILASLPLRVIRRIAMEFAVGLAVALVVQVLVAPSQATSPIRSMAFDWTLDGWVGLQTPTQVGLLGFSLVMYGIISNDAARLARFSLVAGGLLLVVGSQKRAALLITVVAGLAYVSQVYRRRGSLSVVVVVIVVVATLAAQGPVRDFLDREAAHPEAQNATSYRGAIFEASFDRFLERPLLGGGMGVSDRGLLIDVGEEGRLWRSHSEFGNAAAISGVLGVIALAWQYGLSVVTVWRNRAADLAPFIVLIGALSALPFLRILSTLSFLSIPVILLVLPAHGARRFALGAGPKAHSG